MNKKPNYMPPLSALQGFEAAARLGSFSSAAEEQNMTQSAISHQIKSLETYFGQPLFNRVGRSIELTDAGRDFQKTAENSLEMLARGTRRLDTYLKPNQAIISASSAVVANWLLPNFNCLIGSHPEIQPWIYTSDEHDDLENFELDIGIWFGSGNWPGLKVVKLFDDWVTPLCAPSLVSSFPDGQIPLDLSGTRLLHDERDVEWFDWFNAINVQRDSLSDGFNFSDPGHLLDCAIRGHGIALGSLVLAERPIDEGLLVQPFGQAIKTKDAYYLTCLESELRRPVVKNMWDWLIALGEKTNERLKAKLDAQSG
ncbi:MAG: LysR family transcriptional regulator [Pseudomonadota bacterium]